MIDVLESDYILTAKAEGTSSARVLFRHALRNALIPMITVLSVDIGWLVGGTVVIERVFAIPGIGGLMLDAIGNRRLRPRAGHHPRLRRLRHLRLPRRGCELLAHQPKGPLLSINPSGNAAQTLSPDLLPLQVAG